MCMASTQEGDSPSRCLAMRKGAGSAVDRYRPLVQMAVSWNRRRDCLHSCCSGVGATLSLLRRPFCCRVKGNVVLDHLRAGPSSARTHFGTGAHRLGSKAKFLLFLRTPLARPWKPRLSTLRERPPILQWASRRPPSGRPSLAQAHSSCCLSRWRARLPAGTVLSRTLPHPHSPLGVVYGVRLPCAHPAPIRLAPSPPVVDTIPPYGGYNVTRRHTPCRHPTSAPCCTCQQPRSCRTPASPRWPTVWTTATCVRE